MNIRVEELFHEVADLSAEERAQYFIERDVDHDTRREVEALLAFDSGTSAFLLRDISTAAGRALRQIEPKGWRCGPYRLLEVIGRGGMGSVYLAERADGEVTQRLAVKVLPPGAGDPVRERFLQERQILASLTHPNIARMLDAGHLDNGQPFLAMEYVDGKSIDVFAAGLTTREKIALFLKVCAAVGYLHRNLVVHRDLKPSNILVAADGEPKILDFGIAKILDLATDKTRTGMRMLTPDYASPEQVTGGRVSTATDIYSLGAVLYLLLTGKPPHEFEDNSAEAIVSAITTREVTRPRKWAPELNADLEAILLVALRKDPQERYGTVEQFAEDLEAFLESRPVRARSGNAWYRTRKFLRRYWAPAAAAALVIASLSAGLYIANRERAIAQRRFSDVRQLANKLFDIDAQASPLPGSTRTRQLIVDTSLEYLRRLSADVRGDPGLALELGYAYMQVARVQGVSTGRNLGQVDEAAQNLRIAEGLIQSVLASQPANRTALLRAGQIAHDRMILASLQGGRRDVAHRPEVLAFARKSAESLDKFNAGKTDKPEELEEVLGIYMNVADQTMQARQFDEALQICSRASDLARSVDDRVSLAMFHWVSAEVFQQRADLDEALKAMRESVQLLDAGTGRTDVGHTMNLAHVLLWEGRILGQDNGVSLGRSEEASASFERAFRIIDEVVHQDLKDQNSRARLGMAGLGLADILRHSDPRQALAAYDHTLRHLAEISDNSVIRRFEVDALAGSSYPLRHLGRSAEARQRLDTAFERLKQLKLYPAEKVTPGSVTFKSLRALADLEADNGNIPRAMETYLKLLDQIRAAKLEPETFLEDALDLSNIYRAMADLHLRNGQAAQAQTVSALRLELWRTWDRQLPQNPFIRRQLEAAGSR